MLAEHVLLTVVPDVDEMSAGLEEKCQTRPGEEIDAAILICGIGMEEIEVVELTEALIDTPADAAQGDNIGSSRLRLADPSDGLTKIGRFLVGVMDYLSRIALRSVEIMD